MYLHAQKTEASVDQRRQYHNRHLHDFFTYTCLVQAAWGATVVCPSAKSESDSDNGSGRMCDSDDDEDTWSVDLDEEEDGTYPQRC